MLVSTIWRAAAAILAIASAIGVSGRDARAATLEEVRKRGAIVCGVAESAAGLSTVDAKGYWSGLDVDFCAALAAAVLGRKEAVKFRPLTASERFSALRSGEIDVLARATTWTMSRDTELGARFTATLFHDGQGFMVRRSQGVASALELSGATVCTETGGPAETAVLEFFAARKMRYVAVGAERRDDLVKLYAAGRCAALSGDISQLARERSRLAQPADHIILPELASTEPYAPVVRQSDEPWFGIVRWAVMALIAAEELGITSANAEAMRASPVMAVRRLLGVESGPGQSIGLAADWAFQMIRQVGNYGELFERNLGMQSPLRLERRQNALWTKGGLMIAPPVK